uniref:Small ribosomal subunit protein uS4c n=1 Tax=Lepocinclis playfairiana TaxID=1403386 RepID=A0A3G3LLH9_9EUGL|nr:ribosomal protein S4 [Lepocinclis playfairiana]AYQ93558.1 ribosomal protein S4 [Lepocinclis playfairiana]
MSRYRGSRLRIVRRLGKLVAFTNKISKKINPPGQHGSITNKKPSQYKVRLKEKQKLRFYYGVSERQLFNYLKKARKKKGSSGKEILNLLEMRLDNIVYRLGFCPTIVSARQLIVHGHVLVDNVLVNIPSFSCKPGNVIQIKSSDNSRNFVKKNLEDSRGSSVPSHLFLNAAKLEAKVVSRVDLTSLNLIINELLVVEYYSLKI